MNELIDELVETGAYASKGSARRALGLPDPPALPEASWCGKIRNGIAGARPKINAEHG